MEGRSHRQFFAGEPAGGEGRLCPFDLGRAAGKHRLRRGVAIGDHQVELFFGQHLADLRQQRGDCQHAPLVTGAFAHQAAAQARQAVQGALVQAAGGAKGGELAVAVAGDGAGRYTEGLQDAERAQAGRTDGRLRGPGGAQRLLLACTGLGIEGANRIDDIGEEFSVRGGEAVVGGGDAVQQLGEPAGEVVQHAGVLGTLSGEEHAELSAFAATGEKGAVGGLPMGSGVFCQHGPGVFQQGGQVGLVALDHQSQTAGGLFVKASPRGGGQIAQRAPGAFDRNGVEPQGQGRGIDAGKGDDLGVAIPVGGLLDGPVLLEHHMEVGTAKAEGAHPRPSGEVRPLEPGTLFGGDVERSRAGGDFLLGRLHLDGRRNHLVVQRQGGLDQAGGSGGGLGVTDLRLDRSQAAPGIGRVAVHLAQGAHFDRVAYLGAGAVRLDQPDALGGDAGVSIGVAQRLFLPVGARGVDGVPLAVAGGTHAADDGVDPVAVALGVGQALQHHDAKPLAQDGAVGVDVERLGVAGRGQGRGLAETHVHEDVVEGVDAAGDHDVRLARGELHGGQVQRAQRTCASGVHHAVGAAQVVLLADPAGHHVPQKAGKGVLLPRDIGVGDPLHHVLGDRVVDSRILQRRAPDRMTQARAQRDDQLQRAGDAEDDAGAALVEAALRAVPRVLQRLSGRHQAQKLRGVDRLQDVGGDVEFHRVEIDRRYESAPAPVGAVGTLLVPVEILVHRPVGSGDLGDGVHPVHDVRPVGVPVVRLREEAADADDCQLHVVAGGGGGCILSFQRRYSLM